MCEKEKILNSIENSNKWVVVLSADGTADIHEGLLGGIIISLPFEKKEIADLICRCFNAHDILVKQRDDLLAACRNLLIFSGCDSTCSDRKEAEKQAKAAITKAKA